MTHRLTKWRSVVGLLVSFTFVTIAAYRIRASHSEAMAWFALVFFGAVSAGWAYMAATGRASFGRSQRKQDTVILEPGGFLVLTARGQRFTMQWQEVRRVHAFKRDHFTTDEICLLFEGEHRGVEVSEELPGFKDLFGAMEKELGISPAWYIEIMTPAFEPMHRVLFERSQ